MNNLEKIINSMARLLDETLYNVHICVCKSKIQYMATTRVKTSV